MRDQRRAEDSYRDSYHRRGEFESERRSAFSEHSKPPRAVGLGVKIKGRAATNRDNLSPSRAEYPVERKRSHREVFRKTTPSPQRAYSRERPTKRKQVDNPSVSRRHYRDDSKFSPTRRRSPSNSPYREGSNHIISRRRSVSPIRKVIIGRSDRSSSKNRGRDYRPPRASKAERYSHRPQDKSNPTTTIAEDSYVTPAKRHRARSPSSDPKRNSSPVRRDLRSTNRISQSDNKPPVQNYQSSTRDWTARKERGRDSSNYRRHSRSRDRSPPRYQETHRRRNEDRSSSPAVSGRKRKHFRSPRKSERAPWERGKMQSSTRPIQSILDEGSRPPSPPRPIPSFDSDSHDSGAGGLREAYSMHGMKANEVHGSIRSGRLQQIDTRQPYSASPQWTPTSSHHGSPQSGSPFSHGRGSWGGQSQHFHGQQRLAYSILIISYANYIATI